MIKRRYAQCDIITGINGMPAAQYDHAQLKEMFKTENKAFKLKVLRGGETKDFEFTTRILI